MNSHCFYWFPCFENEQVKEINKEIKKFITKKENPSFSAQNVPKKGEFFPVPCLPLMELLHPWIEECQRINRSSFGYDIYWNLHLDEFNYNVYGPGGEYRWHVDINRRNEPVDMKLTCLLNLSEESYEGGEFWMIGYNEKVKFTSGMGLVLNSMIAHKITPVTKGERITLTYWANGVSWR